MIDRNTVYPCLVSLFSLNCLKSISRTATLNYILKYYISVLLTRDRCRRQRVQKLFVTYEHSRSSISNRFWASGWEMWRTTLVWVRSCGWVDPFPWTFFWRSCQSVESGTSLTGVRPDSKRSLYQKHKTDKLKILWFVYLFYN